MPSSALVWDMYQPMKSAASKMSSRRGRRCALGGGVGPAPAHEVGGVEDVVPPGAALRALVFGPSPVQRLAVAVGRALPTHGDHAQRELVGGARVAHEFRFLVDDG